MAKYTIYSNLTNIELISMLESKRGNSPIIDELLNRLEELPEDKIGIQKNISCPVCEAELVLEYDPGNDINYLRSN